MYSLEAVYKVEAVKVARISPSWRSVEDWEVVEEGGVVAVPFLAISFI